MTSSSQYVIASIIGLAGLFGQRIGQDNHLDAIVRCARDRNSWRNSKGLFDQIRARSIRAARGGDEGVLLLLAFEEYCAKSIYNLGRFEAPFDPDSPFQVTASAFRLASYLGIADSEVVAQIAPNR